MANERFISLDAVIKKLKDEIQNFKPVEVFNEIFTEYKKRVIPKLLQDVINYLENQPIVDAVEVVHGRWIVNVEVNNGERVIATCSNCKDSGEVRTDRNEWGIWHIDSPYCPNCGAKMDGDGNA